MEKVARPSSINTVTDVLEIGCGKVYITYTLESASYQEVFALLGKTGGCPSAMLQAITRLATLALNAYPREKVIKQLTGIRCPSPKWTSGEEVLSCPDAIARALKRGSSENVQEPT